MNLLHVAALASALVGWSDITVSPSRGDHGRSSAQHSLANLDRPSERTHETLRRYDLERRYRRDVDTTLAKLAQFAQERMEPDVVYALAELSWLEGRRLDRWRKSASLDHYLDAAAYAFDYLFDGDPLLVSGRNPSDPRFRTACELYNDSVERLIRAAQSDRRIEADGSIKLKVHGNEQVIRVSLNDTPWKPSDIDQIHLASDFVVSGVNAKTYQYGVGVPLIAVRQTDAAGKGDERFYPPEMAFPLTGYLVPKSRLKDAKQGHDGARNCGLELVDPVRRRVVGPPGTPLMVESDFTTPLAYMWSRTDLNRYRWNGLLRPGEAMERANLMLLRPYEPDKIPVVMVHGLISSPLAWIPMLNDLLREPRIQQNYQFFLYMYPTGVPLPVAAALLRDSLQQAAGLYNPSGTNPKFNQMVLLGHSMGGLLSHAMTVDSGNLWWQINSDQPFDAMLGDRAVLAELKNYLFFKPLPYARRVVFLATPHRGSDMSRGVVGRVGNSLIGDTDHVSSLLSKLVKDNPDAFPRRFRRLPTSIETLSPDSDILTALNKMKPNPGVAYHSIIGSLRPEGVEHTTDGVVPYRSAHIEIEGLRSERVVRTDDHGVQKNPEAIREVARILFEHLDAAAANGPAAAVGVTAGPAVR
jgi:pimeloyl-ACP methyl ester carboxylesterase